MTEKQIQNLNDRNHYYCDLEEKCRKIYMALINWTFYGKNGTYSFLEFDNPDKLIEIWYEDLTHRAFIPVPFNSLINAKTINVFIDKYKKENADAYEENKREDRLYIRKNLMKPLKKSIHMKEKELLPDEAEVLNNYREEKEKKKKSAYRESLIEKAVKYYMDNYNGKYALVNNYSIYEDEDVNNYVALTKLKLDPVDIKRILENDEFRMVMISNKPSYFILYLPNGEVNEMWHNTFSISIPLCFMENKYVDQNFYDRAFNKFEKEHGLKLDFNARNRNFKRNLKVISDEEYIILKKKFDAIYKSRQDLLTQLKGVLFHNKSVL